MTIDDLYATCYPVHATEPTRMTVDAPKKAEEVKPEQTAEKAGEVAEQAIENIQPDAGEQPAKTTEAVNTTTINTSAVSTESELKNEETAGN